jgi:hypothetical protein
MGRPVITEDTGAVPYLPLVSGFRFVNDLDTAARAAEETIKNRGPLTSIARETAVEMFDSVKTLRKILGL